MIRAYDETCADDQLRKTPFSVWFARPAPGENQPPGEHLYIAFNTNFPGATSASHASVPREMTIVLQHHYETVVKKTASMELSSTTSRKAGNTSMR